jgi:RNA polymerase sigma-70 factor (ECF subfamily)
MTVPGAPNEGPAPRKSPSSRPTSLSLLQRATSQDDEAWRRLVYLYSPLVYYWCGQQGVRPPDADDVLQEVLQVVMKRLADFRRDRPGDTFRGWLRGITRNLLLAHFRRGKKQPPGEGGSGAWQRLQEVPASSPDEGDDPPSEVEGLHRRALELVRKEFEEGTWQAFWAVAVVGRTPAEVAAERGMTPAAVRQAKSRVLRRLKEELGEVIS